MGPLTGSHPPGVDLQFDRSVALAGPVLGFGAVDAVIDVGTGDRGDHRMGQVADLKRQATLKAITGPANTPSSHHFIPVRLVERQSVRPASAATYTQDQ